MKPKILIVDDEVKNRKLLVSILAKEGYELAEAEDGEQAIESVLRNPLDLILLDVMMPKKDGYQVCAELKQNRSCVNTPIIFLSAKTETEDKVRGLNLGGADYIVKPFDKGELLARVRTQLKIRELTKEVMETNEELKQRQERIEEDLKAAAVIQQSLLPAQLISSPDMEIAWEFLPCEKIGGDLFNIHRLDDHHWAIYIFDVSGHGVSSAMVGVSVYQMLNPMAGLVKKKTPQSPYYHIMSPADVLAALNREYPIDRFDKFFTISYLLLNLNEGTLRYSNAGHVPPILLRHDGTPKILDRGGTIIGIGEQLPIEEEEVSLDVGDMLILYTDGLIEYQNDKGESYGEARFHNHLRQWRDRPVEEILRKIMESLTSFGNGRTPQDDISLLGIKLKRIGMGQDSESFMEDWGKDIEG